MWLNYITEFFYATQNFTMGCLILFMCYYLAKMETIIFQEQTPHSSDKDGSVKSKSDDKENSMIEQNNSYEQLVFIDD